MPVPPAPGPTWRRRLRDIATERLGLKAIALVLALLLWLVASARRPAESIVRVRVAPELDSSLVLLDGTANVRALVAGRAADLVKLAADPPTVRRSVRHAACSSATRIVATSAPIASRSRSSS